jgi:hypothetical protein
MDSAELMGAMFLFHAPQCARFHLPPHAIRRAKTGLVEAAVGRFCLAPEDKRQVPPAFLLDFFVH